MVGRLFINLLLKNMAKEMKTMDAKGMLQKHGKKGTKIFYGTRKKVKVVEETQFLKKGRELNPHEIMADQLIEDGIAVAL